jgi:hypothetical protein
MKLLFLSLLAITYALNIPHNILPTQKKLQLFEYSKEDLLGGIDSRNIKIDEPSIEYLLYVHAKHRLYLRLCNPSISIFEKEELANQFLTMNSTLGPCLQSGGLFDDWNFDTF